MKVSHFGCLTFASAHISPILTTRNVSGAGARAVKCGKHSKCETFTVDGKSQLQFFYFLICCVLFLTVLIVNIVLLLFHVLTLELELELLGTTGGNHWVCESYCRSTTPTTNTAMLKVSCLFAVSIQMSIGLSF